MIGRLPKHLLPEPESSHARGELNRSVQNGTLDLRVELRQVQQVDVPPGLITKPSRFTAPKVCSSYVASVPRASRNRSARRSPPSRDALNSAKYLQPPCTSGLLTSQAGA